MKPLDVITVVMDRPRYENEIIPEDIPLNIVYEDKYVMVVNCLLYTSFFRMPGYITSAGQT